MVTGDYSLLLIKSHQRGPKFFLYNFIYFPPFQKLSFLPGIGFSKVVYITYSVEISRNSTS